MATATGKKNKKTTTVKKGKSTKTETTDVKPGNKTLYDISKDYSELEHLLEETEGDMTEDQQGQIDEYLLSLGEERDAKVDNYCGLIRSLEARGKARKEEADRFAKLARYDLNKVKSLKFMLLQFMITHEMSKMETIKFRVRRAANGQAPLKLGKRFLENPEDLPEAYRLTSYKADLKKIREDLKEGIKLDFASFDEKGENIRIE